MCVLCTWPSICIWNHLDIDERVHSWFDEVLYSRTTVTRNYADYEQTSAPHCSRVETQIRQQQHQVHLSLMLVPGSEGFVHGRSSRWHVLGNVLSDAFQRSGDARDAFLHASLSDDCANLYAVAACVDANVHGFDVGVDEDADGDADSLVADSGKSAAPIAPGAPSAPVVGFAACPRDEIAASVARVAPAAPLGTSGRTTPCTGWGWCSGGGSCTTALAAPCQTPNSGSRGGGGAEGWSACASTSSATNPLGNLSAANAVGMSFGMSFDMSFDIFCSFFTAWLSPPFCGLFWFPSLISTLMIPSSARLSASCNDSSVSGRVVSAMKQWCPMSPSQAINIYCCTSLRSHLSKRKRNTSPSLVFNFRTTMAAKNSS